MFQISHSIEGNGARIRAHVFLYSVTEWVTTLGHWQCPDGNTASLAVIARDPPELKWKEGCCREGESHKERAGGVWTAAQMIFISMMHPHAEMEPFVTNKHMTATFIYATCFLEEQPIMVHEIHKRDKIIGYYGFETFKYHQGTNASKLCWRLQCVDIYLFLLMVPCIHLTSFYLSLRNSLHVIFGPST